jgi:hypothetical protein
LDNEQVHRIMTMQDNTSGDTGNGFIAGVQPAQPRLAADWAQGTPAQQVTQQQPVQVVPQQTQQPSNGVAPRWTDEDLERARQQEKDKLYGRLDEVQTQMRQFQAEREAEQAERQRLADEAAEALRSKEESEMEIRDLLARRETEWQQQLTRMEQRFDADRAVFDKERAFTEVQTYRRDRIEQESEYILPELREFVTGDTIEAVDASIEVIKARSEQIFANMQAANQQLPPFQQAPRAASPTAPPVGPMEQMPTYETLTPEDIKGMDMETYKRYRTQLLQATSPQRRPQR